MARLFYVSLWDLAYLGEIAELQELFHAACEQSRSLRLQVTCDFVIENTQTIKQFCYFMSTVINYFLYHIHILLFALFGTSLKGHL